MDNGLARAAAAWMRGDSVAAAFPVMPVPGEAHVWLVDFIGEPAMELLSEQEHARYEAMKSARARAQFAHSRAALRTLLSRYLNRPADSLAITCVAGEQPALLEPDALPFSYSHTEGRGAIAFARDGAIGVDIERPDPARDYAGIAARFFSSEERAEYFVEPPEARDAVFLRLWTRKESVMKAAGVGLRGLSTPVDADAYRVYSHTEGDAHLALASACELRPTLFHYPAALQPTLENE